MFLTNGPSGEGKAPGWVAQGANVLSSNPRNKPKKHSSFLLGRLAGMIDDRGGEQTFYVLSFHLPFLQADSHFREIVAQNGMLGEECGCVCVCMCVCVCEDVFGEFMPRITCLCLIP